MNTDTAIPLFKNYITPEDCETIESVIKRRMGWANGPEIEKFEAHLAEVVGTKYGVAFNSGTSALHCVLESIGVKDKEVIVPSFSFISSANAIIMAGGVPVFVDIENRTFGMDAYDLKQKITPKTAAIIVVHYAGHCVGDIREIMDIAEEHGIPVIEDAAEALGSTFHGLPVGSIGLASIVSFAPTKVISTGEGGAAFTNSKEIHDKLKLLRSHGREETQDYFTTIDYMDYISMGYNFRMPTICAALGLSQLGRLKEHIEYRRKISTLYKDALIGVPDINLPTEIEGILHTYQMYTITIPAGHEKRDALQKYLKKKGVSTKVYFKPIHKTHYYKNILGYDIELPQTERLSDTVLTLPIYPDLTKKQVLYISKLIKTFFKVTGES